MRTQTHAFSIVRSTDDQIVELTAKAFAEAEVTDARIVVHPVVGQDFEHPLNAISSHEQIRQILDKRSTLTKAIKFKFANNHITIKRSESHSPDTVEVQLGEPANPNLMRILTLVDRLKFHLREIRPSEALSIFEPQLQQHYQIREAEVARLEIAVSKLATSMAEEIGRTRRQLEEEFAARRDQIEKIGAANQEKFESDMAKGHNDLQAREELLKKHIASIDDRDARHVRRQIRSDIKAALAQRSERFELTRGTRRLRLPVQIFSMLLIVMFGAGLIFYSVEGVAHIFRSESRTEGITSDTWAIALRLAIFGAAFGSTTIFYIRWNNRWFEQHASEEFQLKRLELDLDRASWVVEMAMEWKGEKGSDIPAHLLDRLTTNLFSPTQVAQDHLHPADQLASALLGSASEATLKLPGGSELKMDRKAIRDLDKQKGKTE